MLLFKLISNKHHRSLSLALRNGKNGITKKLKMLMNNLIDLLLFTSLFKYNY